jgi:hypothetical protein
MAAAAVDSRSCTDEERGGFARVAANSRATPRLGNRFAPIERSRGIEDSLEGANDEFGDSISAIWTIIADEPSCWTSSRVRDRARPNMV